MAPGAVNFEDSEQRLSTSATKADVPVLPYQRRKCHLKTSTLSAHHAKYSKTSCPEGLWTPDNRISQGLEAKAIFLPAVGHHIQWQGECQRTSLMRSQKWFKWWPGAITPRTVTTILYYTEIPPLLFDIGFCIITATWARFLCPCSGWACSVSAHSLLALSSLWA